MTDHLVGDADLSNERRLSFWMTLIVTTLIVGFAGFVLGSAMLGAGAGAGLSSHRAAVSSFSPVT